MHLQTRGGSRRWVFIAFAVAITVIAAVVAYHGSETTIANTPVPHIAGSPG